MSEVFSRDKGILIDACWSAFRYLVINDVVGNRRYPQKHQYLPLFPSARVVVFRRCPRDSGEMTIGPGRQVLQRRCSLYVHKPVHWSVVDTIMRSTSEVLVADAAVIDILFPRDISDDTEPNLLPPTVADNIRHINITGDGQLIPDRSGPFDATKFSVVGCHDPSFLHVNLISEASLNLSVDTLTGLLRLSASLENSRYASGAVVISANFDFVPKCFTAVSLNFSE